MADQGEMKDNDQDLSPDMKHWSKQQVREWVLKLEGVDNRAAETLFQQDITGSSLLLLEVSELKEMGVTFGPAKLIIHARDEFIKLKKDEPTSFANQSGRPCKPYPFQRYHNAYRYIEGNILDIPESGASGFIEPCHEYKSFINTTEETKMYKFTTEVIRFAAACMNSCTNGTIHFGIGDKPEGFTHGQVLGVVVDDKEAYGVALKSEIDCFFEHKHKLSAQKCIKPPRFVGVLNKDMTSSDKCVIEVDIVPDSTICGENFYHTSMSTKKKKSKVKETVTTETNPSKQLFIRDGGSSRNLFPHTTSAKDAKEYNDFIGSVKQRAQLRKQAEEKHLRGIKSSNQGSKLSQMITGGTASLDRSHYERYVIVTNKSHSVQFESLGFLVELNPTAVLDFDPQSAQNGLQQHFEKHSPVTVHLPDQYKITGDVKDIANNLQLTRNTSWVFCNGKMGEEEPSEINHWMMDKGASIRGVTSFLCRKDVLPNKRFLVVFLLLSTVSDTMDPLVETFSTFLQELKGTEQILCICDNEQAFTSWRDLIQARCGIDISSRCIYELSLSEVNGTVLSLCSENRRSSRFLPCGGGGKVILEKKMERSLNTLDVLCVNQCEGGNEDKIPIEENFYKGGEVSWWNFFFSEQPGSTPFIKRDKFAYITDTIIPELCSERKACMLLNLIHIAGCGGTTLAMHTLWELRDRFRCAVLLDNNANFAKVADQVVTLLTYKCEEQSPHTPVLLMIDDFDEMERVFDLQQLIENECVKRQSQSKCAQVILLNCMRSESSEHDQNEPTKDTVFIGNKLSEKEQKQFEQKYEEIEKTHAENAETFYGFMIMKKNLEEGYIQSVACNTLKSFNFDQKSAQLLAVLVLLSAYCNRATLSVSLCEEFLGLQPKPFCGTIKVEEGFGKFSTLITCREVKGKVVFKAIKLIHSKIAWHCLQELTAKHNISKAKITDFLLTTEELYDCVQGKDKLMEYVRYILVQRFSLKEESQVQATVAIPAGEKDDKKSLETRFSPLIRHIENETPGLEEMVLINASHRFQKDAGIAQLLARYYYLKKKNFEEAKLWAKTAKNLSKDSSYFSDTAAQVIKHELKTTIGNEKVPIGPEALERLLKLAKSATDAFKETQNLAKTESMRRLQTKAGNCPFNTAGYLGEIQVGVHVIEVLKKIPIFSAGNVRHDILSQMLSGTLKLDQIKKNDPGYRKNIQYYIILQKFDEDLLYWLKCRMKMNFDLLDNFHVNLGSRFGMEETREQIMQNELFRCYKQYADLFCKTDSAALLKNKNMNRMLQLHQARQYLEMQRADTYSGILNYLSKDAKDVQPAILEKIAKQYEFICTHDPSCSAERINYIYINVVLSCIKLESDQIRRYQELVNFLCQILHKQISLNDSLPLFFIAVVLLWPQQYLSRAESGNLGKYISQMRSCYHSTMKEFYNGKRPIIHFFLGKKQGYERLVHLGQVKRIIKAGKEQFASMWENGLIWKNPEVNECLCRVPGEVRGRNILANTLIPNLKIEVTPMFQSQLRNLSDGSKVSFFIGFSMKGPLAIDIYETTGALV